MHLQPNYCPKRGSTVDRRVFSENNTVRSMITLQMNRSKLNIASRSSPTSTLEALILTFHGVRLRVQLIPEGFGVGDFSSRRNKKSHGKEARETPFKKMTCSLARKFSHTGKLTSKFPHLKRRELAFSWSRRFFRAQKLGKAWAVRWVKEKAEGDTLGDPMVDHPSVTWPRVSQSSQAPRSLGTPLCRCTPGRPASSLGAGGSTQAGRHFQGVEILCRQDDCSPLSASRGILSGSAGVQLGHWPGCCFGFCTSAHPCSLTSSRFSERTGQRPPHQHLPLFCPQSLVIIIEFLFQLQWAFNSILY